MDAVDQADDLLVFVRLAGVQQVQTDLVALLVQRRGELAEENDQKLAEDRHDVKLRLQRFFAESEYSVENEPVDIRLLAEDDVVSRALQQRC